MTTLEGRLETAGLAPTAERFRIVRERTESLALPLSAEDQTVQSMPDVSPTKWHRAHTSWFFETFLLRPLLADYREFDERFNFLFNSYYEAVGARYPRPSRGLISRPGIEEIAAYRRHVDAQMERLCERGLDAEGAALFELGLNHEEQHQELLLMDAKHVLSHNPLDPAYLERPKARRSNTPGRPARWRSHPGGPIEIGASEEPFTFDNEHPRHRVQLVPFELCDQVVTCGEWIEFIADGGYRRADLWLSDGWATVCAEHWEAPLYWRAEGAGSYSAFTLSGRLAVDPNEPVCHVSYYEADAFARWAGARLPTEFEWEAIASGSAPAGNFLNTGELHPSPAEGPSWYGDVWCWTASAYLPYPGFRPARGAVGEYNGKFMVNQHVLRGGACVTPPGHVRSTYRNFFPPAARWPFTGLRLARDL